MKNFGLYLVLLKIFGKIGPVFITLLKSAKVAKVGLAGASLAAYSYMFTWQFALIIIFAIIVHEYGHLTAMKNLGIKTKGIWLIPFVGGAAVASEEFGSYKNESYVAIMGPIYGILTIIPFYLLYIYTKDPIYSGIMSFIALVNVFNLLPINPLDGGRILKSIAFSFNSIFGIIFLSLGMIGAFYLAYTLNINILYFIIVIGIIEIIAEFKNFKFFVEKKVFEKCGEQKLTKELYDIYAKDKYMNKFNIFKYLFLYLVVFFIFLGVIYYCASIDGSDLALKLLKDDINIEN